MTIANAIKKLERNGWTVSHTDRHYVANKEGVRNVISFLPNGKDLPENSAVCLRVRNLSDRDDMQSDYTAGVFVDSMAQALRLAVL
jgi:beta-lactam-binding protein with PASTA domain